MPCRPKIPASSAKEYADKCAERLSREEYMKYKQDIRADVELGEDYEEYLEKIKRLDTFFKCYRMMMETGVWTHTMQNWITGSPGAENTKKY